MMALFEWIGGAYFPTPPQFPTSGQPNQIGFILDASGEKYYAKVYAPRSGTVEAFEFATGSTIGHQVTNGLRVSFQAVDNSTGDPSGTQIAYRTVTSVGSLAWIAPGKITSDGTDTGNPFTVTQGDTFCCVIEFESFATSDKVAINSNISTTPARNVYSGTFGASWTKDSTSTPAIALRYSDGSFPALSQLGGVYPVYLTSNSSVSTSLTFDEAGMVFSFPAPVMIGGVMLHADVDADVEIRVYQPPDYSTPVRTAQLKTSHRNTNGYGLNPVPFAPLRINANDEYIVSVYNNTSTSVRTAAYTVNSSNKLDLAEGGSAWRLAQRDNGGPWTFTSTQRPFISVLVQGLDHEIGGQPTPGFEGVA